MVAKEETKDKEIKTEKQNDYFTKWLLKTVVIKRELTVLVNFCDDMKVGLHG